MEEELVDIGLNKNEAKVYLAIIELGSTTIGNVAKKSKVHRTNVYDTVDGLINKGLVSYIIKEKTKYFQVSDFHNLLNMIREKEDKAKQILPQLALLHNLAEKKSEANVLEGLDAAKRTMDHFLSYQEPILVTGVPSNVAQLIGPFLTRFHKARIEQKILMRHIYNTDAHARVRALRDMPYTEIRVLPGKFDSPVATNIVGEEVTLIYWSKDPLIIQIKSLKIADVYKKYYELLWKQARPPKR